MKTDDEQNEPTVTSSSDYVSSDAGKTRRLDSQSTTPAADRHGDQSTRPTGPPRAVDICSARTFTMPTDARYTFDTFAPAGISDRQDGCRARDRGAAARAPAWIHELVSFGVQRVG